MVHFICEILFENYCYFETYFETGVASRMFISIHKLMAHFKLNLTTVCRYGTFSLENKSEGDFC